MAALIDPIDGDLALPTAADARPVCPQTAVVGPVTAKLCEMAKLG